MFDMLLGFFSTNGKKAAEHPLSVRVRLYDGTDITVNVEGAELVFKTALGISKIALKNIAWMENTSKAETTRKLMDANKFEIHCIDGCKIVGVPKSPAKIHLNGVNAPHERGDIKLWEIDWLQVQSGQHDEYKSSF